ncbi:predicted protein [Histoplasma capsulatum var. duboisii H88]|uniref:Predicted protein n=1 Tax=Ajellomyces capsulatus (strain H88) TaxID=544711 RepID=F0UGI6_AJEC8|nr:predicted protein [Histoplasma capsulatum var. duboisii H88]
MARYVIAATAAMTAMTATTHGHVERVIYGLETVAAAGAITRAGYQVPSRAEVTGARGARWVLAEEPFARPIGGPLAQARHRKTGSPSHGSSPLGLGTDNAQSNNMTMNGDDREDGGDGVDRRKARTGHGLQTAWPGPSDASDASDARDARNARNGCQDTITRVGRRGSQQAAAIMIGAAEPSRAPGNGGESLVPTILALRSPRLRETPRN